MLCEVPVIGSDSGAIPEIIGDAGVIFRESDVEGLTEAIRRLGDDHELRSSLAETGLERARRTFVGTYSTVMLEWLQDAAGMPLRGG